MSESTVIRDLNKVYLFQGNEWFEAYMTEGFEYTVENIVDSMSDLAPGALATLAINAGLGMVPAFDMPRYFGYKGSKPIAFTIDCYLRLGDEAGADPIKIIGDIKVGSGRINPYQKSILAPLLKLYAMMLPTRKGGPISDMGFIKAINSMLSAIPVVGVSLSTVTDQIYMLEVPKGFQAYGEGGSMNRIDMKIGSAQGNPSGETGHPMNFGQVIIKSVTVSQGKLMIDRGYPDRVNIKIGLETMRVATVNSLAIFFGEKATK